MLLSFDFLQMLIKFAICFVVNLVIVNRLYYPKSRRRDFYFTFMMTSTAVFFLMYFMMDMKAKATLGVGIGLFGIFSIMRYRTDSMPVREMSYLFLLISLSVITAIAPIGDEHSIDVGHLLELLVTDAIIVVIITVFERVLKVSTTKLIQYDRVELAKPEKYDELVEDLKARTGLDITSVDVGGIDFLKDSVVLKVHYEPSHRKGANSVAGQFKVSSRELLDI